MKVLLIVSIMTVGCATSQSSTSEAHGLQAELSHKLNGEMAIFQGMPTVKSHTKAVFNENGDINSYTSRDKRGYKRLYLPGNVSGDILTEWHIDGDEIIFRDNEGNKFKAKVSKESIVPIFEFMSDKILCEAPSSMVMRFSLYEAGIKDDPLFSTSQNIYITHELPRLIESCQNYIVEAGKKRLLLLTKTYGKKYAKTIIEQRFQIGMTKAMVIESIGEPMTINRTVTHYGNSEQWVYGNNGTYLYFSGDRLDSFQVKESHRKSSAGKL